VLFESSPSSDANYDGVFSPPPPPLRFLLFVLPIHFGSHHVFK